MAIKPILFNSEMVRANLDGRKSCTRRIIKPQWEECPHCKYVHKEYIYDKLAENIYCASCGYPLVPERRAPYQPGDILYVRESVFQGVGRYLDVSGETVCVLTNDFEYYADGLHEKDHWKDKHEHTWMHRRPSIHMPKEAARIWLKVTDVRVERLQEITEDGAKREGIQYYECPTGFTWKQETDMHNCYTTPIGAMQALWNSTIKKSDLDRYGWGANPWVWVIEFERCEKPETL